MTTKTTRLIVLGATLLFFGACGVMTGVVMLISLGEPGSEDLQLSTALCPLFGSLPLVVLGVMLLRTTSQRQRQSRQQEIEAKVLHAAIARNYRITVPEVAMMTDLSLEEAQRYLERLARQGQVAVELDERGVLIYCFSDVRR